MSGDRGSRCTRSTRAAEAAIRTASVVVRRGCVASIRADDGRSLTACTPRPPARLAALPTAASVAVIGSVLPGDGAGGIGSPETAESADQSTNPASIMTAPCPSAMAWWASSRMAALSPSSPSTSVARHSGRSRSRSYMLWRRTCSMSCSHEPGFGST